jgi:hypothetical protein
MQRIVINRGWHDMCLSRKAVELMAELGDEGAKREVEALKDNPDWRTYYDMDADMYEGWTRTNPYLIQVVEALGKEASALKDQELVVVYIPDGVEWYIERDDETGGFEAIHEKHRIWVGR